MKHEYNDNASRRFVGTSYGTTVVGNICSECIHNNAKYSVFGEQPKVCCISNTTSCSAKTPYFFFKSRTNTVISVFSKGRIPFEVPKADAEGLDGFKKELILAVNQLTPFNDSVLFARYGTTERSKNTFDLENVLFYNLGTKNFNALGKLCVTFTTVSNLEIQKMRDQWNIPEEYSHYYEYALLTKPISLPQNNGLLAEWTNIQFCKCTGLTPFASWYSMKEEASNIKVYNKIDCSKGDCFSLILEIEKPQHAKLSIMTAMKPLLDGIICAFHSSSFEKEEIELFSQRLNCDKDRFQNQSLSVLECSGRKYIQIYRRNVKWNPADDLCHYICISIREGNNWKLSGKIYKA